MSNKNVFLLAQYQVEHFQSDNTFGVNPDWVSNEAPVDVLFNSEADALAMLDRQVALGLADRDEMSGAYHGDSYAVASLEDEGFPRVWRLRDTDREGGDVAMLLFEAHETERLRDVLVMSEALRAKMAQSRLEGLRTVDLTKLTTRAAA
jgi:hypothetical protein